MYFYPPATLCKNVKRLLWERPFFCALINLAVTRRIFIANDNACTICLTIKHTDMLICSLRNQDRFRRRCNSSARKHNFIYGRFYSFRISQDADELRWGSKYLLMKRTKRYRILLLKEEPFGECFRVELPASEQEVEISWGFNSVGTYFAYLSRPCVEIRRSYTLVIYFFCK